LLIVGSAGSAFDVVDDSRLWGQNDVDWVVRKSHFGDYIEVGAEWKVGRGKWREIKDSGPNPLRGGGRKGCCGLGN